MTTGRDEPLWTPSARALADHPITRFTAEAARRTGRSFDGYDALQAGFIILALARPEAPVTVAREEATIVLVLDVSGSMEAQDEWRKLESKWDNFEARAKLDSSARDVGAALDLLGSELKAAYERIAKAV
ncbi:MAG TPA: hypothetical protein PKA74_15030 [Bauldia sp.]|nr:hypothetical protein [Bauldia sp.]